MELQNKLGFGLMRMPMLPNGKVDIPLLSKMVDAFLERGFTYFDTAWMYCDSQSEAAIGEALVKRHPRDSFTLTTKLHSGFVSSFEDRDAIFNEQLRRTGVDYFDYYLIHDLNSESVKIFEQFDCFEWLKAKKAAGLVRTIGFSCHDNPEFLEKILTEHPEMELVQLQVNYLDWESAGVQSRRCYEVAEKFHKPVIVMEPVKGGTLSNVPAKVDKLFKESDPTASVASWAIRFAASLPGVFKVLSGMSTLEQVLDNTSYMQTLRPITDGERAVIEKAVTLINADIAIPCTGCSYCTGGCPMNIAIPQYFSLYNADKQEYEGKGWMPQASYYHHLVEQGRGKASDCIGCGQCEGICPQHLPVITHLKEVAHYFEVEKADE